MSTGKAKDNLVWIDLETSGLDSRGSVILEIATIITDKSLNIIAVGPQLVIHQPEEALDKMDGWCKKQHGDSGLTEAVRCSSVSVSQAEEETLNFVSAHCPPKACPLCGNSICFDRRFLIKYMPRLNALLSYRNVDVSSIKELVNRWYPERTTEGSKASRHRAMEDIQESIRELSYYRTSVFKGK
ncbi:MAG: oligoribonuclease [Candidatus Bipolaricaulota bacterium]|nr:oligoribonuclease [Candidatus Bipolaricaulota bacterium]